MAKEIQRIRRLISTPADDCELVSSLSWRVVTENKGSLTKIAKEVGAKAFVSYKSSDPSAHRETYGLYVPVPLEEGTPLPKNCYSAAAVFAAAVGEFAPSAALILNLPDGRRYVVVLTDGLPYADYIDTENRVEESVRHVEVLYSNDTTTFPGESVTVEWLFEQAKAHPSYALKSIPMDKVAVAGMAAVALVACGLLGGLYLYNKKAEAEKAAKELAAAQAADPTPVYMANLAMRRMQMMVPSAAWTRLYERVATSYATAPGWIRVKVVCNVKGCVSTWVRKGGNHPELTSFLKEQQEVVAPALSGALDAAQSTIAADLKGVAGAATYPAPDAWLRANVETIQNWKNARFSPTVGDFVLWPATPDIPPTFRTVGALNAAPINITVPGALLAEVLETTPAGVSWESMSFTLNAGGSPSERVTVQMTGVVYAALPN